MTSRNQVSPSQSDVEMDRTDQGQGQWAEPATNNESWAQDRQHVPLSRDSGFGHNSPQNDGKPSTGEDADVQGSRSSLRSGEKTGLMTTPDYTLEHESSDVSAIPDMSKHYQTQEDHSSLVSSEIPILHEEQSEVHQDDPNKNHDSPIEEFRPESRFVRTQEEDLIYEPGLPQVKQDDSELNYQPPPAEEGPTTYNYKKNSSEQDDKHPLVFDKDHTAFEGTFGGPPMQQQHRHLSPVSSNQIRPLDTVMYQQTEAKQQYPRKNSLIIGADENTDGAGCCGWLLYIFSILLILVTLPFSLIFTIKVVQEYERAVIFRLGRLPSGGAKGPGIFFIIPCIESYTKVDLRTVSFDVPPQEVLTKDSVTVSVDAVVYYRVSNPTVSVANVENAHHSTRLLAQTTLRNILGTKNMTEILSDRESISQGMQSTLDVATDRWGIKVERVEIKDVRLPVQLQRAMAAEAEADREARAKVIAAEGEQKAARSLKEAADVIATSGAALQLRYLQTLNSISAEKNSTIIFPLPVDMLSSFMKK